MEEPFIECYQFINENNQYDIKQLSEYYKKLFNKYHYNKNKKFILEILPKYKINSIYFDFYSLDITFINQFYKFLNNLV